MRIIGGEAGGRPIHLPKGCRIRPTSDRIKESLFALLEPLAGDHFLDLFAGCGNVGLEALSRGASRCVFVEKGPKLAAAIRENGRLLGFQGRAEVITAEADSGLRRLRQRTDRFHILFADPPYEEGFVAEMGGWLSGSDLLEKDGIVVLQHSVREPLDLSQWLTMAVADQRRYGDTLLTFLKIKKREMTS